MRSIFSRYYKEDKDVTEDVELQTYVNEVSFNGSGPNGGLGRVNMTINHKTHLGCRLRGLILVLTPLFTEHRMFRICGGLKIPRPIFFKTAIESATNCSYHHSRCAVYLETGFGLQPFPYRSVTLAKREFLKRTRR